ARDALLQVAQEKQGLQNVLRPPQHERKELFGDLPLHPGERVFVEASPGEDGCGLPRVGEAAVQQPLADPLLQVALLNRVLLWRRRGTLDETGAKRNDEGAGAVRQGGPPQEAGRILRLAHGGPQRFGSASRRRGGVVQLVREAGGHAAEGSELPLLLAE